MSDVNKIRNALTEHKSNYKLYNPYLLDAYSSLMPSSMSKISLVLFNSILSNKLYFKEDSNYFSESEDKRIYNTTVLTPEHLLMQCNPSKYLIEKRDMQLDVGNLVKKLNELDDQNIFYMWKMGHPNLFMFFIERDIGVWKAFNLNGVVTPKTLVKIVRWSNVIAETMKKMLEQEGQKFDKKEVEKSFGTFINRLIGKMAPEVSQKFQLYKLNDDIGEFSKKILSDAEPMSGYEGLTVDDNFINRLPVSLRNKLLPKTKEKDMNLFDIEEEIVPKQGNLVRVKQTRKKKLLKTAQVEGIDAEIRTYSQEVDPLKNCNEFLHFYRDTIRSKRPNAKFSDMGLDRKDATEILDMMILSNRSTKRFLSGWIFYYVDAYMPQHLPADYQKTALSNFRRTFNEFSGRYVELV